MSTNQEAESAEDAYMDAIEREVELAKILKNPARLTWVLLVAIILLGVAALFFGSFVLTGKYGFQTKYLSAAQLAFYTGMKVNIHIDQGQWWRLLSSTFVHMDPMHVAFNGYGLYALGPFLERIYGRSRFFALYVLTGLIAAGASYAFNESISGGASGALYGLVGASLVLGYKERKHLPKRLSRALTIGSLPWVVIGIGIGFIGTIPFDNEAHIGGLLSGMVLAFFLQSKVGKIQNKQRTLIARIVAFGCVLCLVATFGAWANETFKCTQSKNAYLTCYPELMPAITPMAVSP